MIMRKMKKFKFYFILIKNIITINDFKCKLSWYLISQLSIIHTTKKIGEYNIFHIDFYLIYHMLGKVHAGKFDDCLKYKH